MSRIISALSDLRVASWGLIRHRVIENAGVLVSSECLSQRYKHSCCYIIPHLSSEPVNDLKYKERLFCYEMSALCSGIISSLFVSNMSLQIYLKIDDND